MQSALNQQYKKEAKYTLKLITWEHEIVLLHHCDVNKRFIKLINLSALLCNLKRKIEEKIL
jgi:hypothetical protein